MPSGEFGECITLHYINIHQLGDPLYTATLTNCFVYMCNLFVLQVIFFGGGWVFFLKKLFRDYEVSNEVS